MSARPLSKQIAISFVVLCLLAVGVIAQAQTNVEDGAEVFDLRSWRNQKGRTLADVNQGHSMALVVLVSPNCDTCAKSTKAIEALRERAKKAGMAYYVLMIPDGTDTQKYFSYADSLKLNAESFVWSNPEAKASATLATMPVPSHVLMSTDRFEGRIVNKWPGVPPSTSFPAQVKFIKHKKTVPNDYIVVLNDDVISNKSPIDVRRAQVSAIADSFAKLHGGKVGFIYETALFGFSIELPTQAAAIAISLNPQVKFVEENAIGSFNAKIEKP